MASRFVGALKAITSVTVIMAGIAFLKYAYVIEHLSIK